MSRLSKALIAGLLIGLVGLIFVPFMQKMEENIGLDLLFKQRGTKEVPSDVIIVSMNRLSADHLNLPAKPDKWPRWVHANLTENLTKQGAAVIAFDVIFEEARSPEYDNLFAKAIRNAKNVVLGECLRKETAPLTDQQGRQTGELHIEKLLPPIPSLAESAVALAPFPLPKVPAKVSQYWTFKTGAGDTPTLPVVVFQIFALNVYDEFIQLLDKISPSQAESLPHKKDTIITTGGVENLIRTLRGIFDNHPLIAEKMLEEIEKSGMLSDDLKKKKLLVSLIKMYQSPDTLHLNFYGPPGKITTLPYYQALKPQEKSTANQMQFDFKGKAVFVGLSEPSMTEQRDGFYTTFTQPSGVDMNGVEIAATAFSNLLEDMPVRHISLFTHLTFVLLWGLLLGIFCRLFSTVITLGGVICLSVLYFSFAQYQFRNSGIWYPLVVPLFFQAPLAFFGTVLWKYFDTSKERQNIRRAFGYYLPDKVVDQLTKSTADIGSSGQIVYGTCLWTDAEQYTSLSESMNPKEFSSFMNRYFEAVFEPVKRYGGIVSNVVGDSMLAIWATTSPDSELRKQGCLAALDIARAVHQFNQSSDKLKLPTRIGLHSGQLLLGNVGAFDHYEYRPVGDIVNTSTRLENLNKYLGTRILVSEEVLHQLDGFLTRELGEFLLVGKSNPILVHELICRIEDSSEQQKRLCAIFKEALSAYKRKSWEEAIEKLHESLQIDKEDRPSLFYLELCEKYRENPPAEIWDGIVCMDKK